MASQCETWNCCFVLKSTIPRAKTGTASEIRVCEAGEGDGILVKACHELVPYGTSITLWCEMGWDWDWDCTCSDDCCCCCCVLVVNWCCCGCVVVAGCCVAACPTMVDECDEAGSFDPAACVVCDVDDDGVGMMWFCCPFLTSGAVS